MSESSVDLSLSGSAGVREVAESLVAGALNFRDTGGLPAGDGRTRERVLYRSGNLAELDAAGTAALGGLGVRRIIDLRDDYEVTNWPSRIEGLDVETVRVPLFVGSVRSFFQRDTSLAEMYRMLVQDSAERVVEVVRGVLAHQPVLVHCTVGKDRTGVTVALTLAAAGVDEDAIVADYARTEGMLPEWRNREALQRLTALHPEATHLEDLATKSPAHVMHDLLGELTARYGSPTDYLRAQGLADDEVRELRRVLITRDGDSAAVLA